MHFLLLGASGRTGAHIVSQALEEGHTLTALLRKPSSIEARAGVTIVSGSPLSLPDLRTAITSSPKLPTAILVALSSLRKGDSPFSAAIGPPNLMEDVHKNLLILMEEFTIKKLVTISAWGVGMSIRSVPFPLRLVLNHSQMSIGQKDHGKVEDLLRSKGAAAEVEWTLVKPVVLSDGPKVEVREFEESGQGVGWMPKINRASVAGFLLEVLEDKSGRWARKAPVIAE